MLKKTMTYTDYNGEERTEDFYFNVSKAELAALEIETPGGFGKYMQDIADAKDGKELVRVMKLLINMAIGEKSLDGRRFIKSDEIRLDFQQTEAYSDLFMSMATDENAALSFITGMLPEGMSSEDIMSAAKEAQDTGRKPSDIIRERSEGQMQGHKKPATVELRTVNEPAKDPGPDTSTPTGDKVGPSPAEIRQMTPDQFDEWRRTQ